MTSNMEILMVIKLARRGVNENHDQMFHPMSLATAANFIFLSYGIVLSPISHRRSML